MPASYSFEGLALLTVCIIAPSLYIPLHIATHSLEMPLLCALAPCLLGFLAKFGENFFHFELSRMNVSSNSLTPERITEFWFRNPEVQKGFMTHMEGFRIRKTELFCNESRDSPLRVSFLN